MMYQILEFKPNTKAMVSPQNRPNRNRALLVDFCSASVFTKTSKSTIFAVFWKIRTASKNCAFHNYTNRNETNFLKALIIHNTSDKRSLK